MSLTQARWSRRRVLRGSLACLILAAGCGPAPSAAPPPKPLAKIGVLCLVCPSTFEGAAPPGPLVATFLQELRARGHVDGETVTLLWRGAGGQNEPLASLAEELVAQQVDVLVAAGAGPAAAAAKRATATIPIVFLGVGDPVFSGFVASYARPGGNMTGTSTYSAETVGKRLELLKAVAPGVARVGGLYDFGSPAGPLEWRDAQDAAGRLGLDLQALDVRTFADVEAAFRAMGEAPPDGLLVSGDPFLAANQKRLLELVGTLRRPAVFNRREWVADGGLISYGFNLAEQYRQVAVYVDKILKGAKPADLPVELPREFDLAVNRKTAQALGLTIPQVVLQQATEVIE